MSVREWRNKTKEKQADKCKSFPCWQDISAGIVATIVVLGEAEGRCGVLCRNITTVHVSPGSVELHSRFLLKRRKSHSLHGSRGCTLDRRSFVNREKKKNQWTLDHVSIVLHVCYCTAQASYFSVRWIYKKNRFAFLKGNNWCLQGEMW